MHYAVVTCEIKLFQYITTRSTQPGHPTVVGAMNTSQRAEMPCGWGVKAGEVWFVIGWQVKLCDRLAITGHI